MYELLVRTLAELKVERNRLDRLIGALQKEVDRHDPSLRQVAAEVEAPSQVRRVVVEIGETAYRKLTAEVDRRTRSESRGKKYPVWRIIDELLQTLPSSPPVRLGPSEVTEKRRAGGGLE